MVGVFKEKVKRVGDEKLKCREELEEYAKMLGWKYNSRKAHSRD